MQPSFFDYAMEYQGGKKSMKFLSEMKELIPFDIIEARLIEESIYKPNKGQQGRPSIPSKILIGALFLQAWYGLSDPMVEELMHDRISFRKFLDIKDSDTIPDETTVCKFRKALIEANLFEYIFKVVRNEMIKNNLILNEGTLVDATLIHSSEPKRKKDESGKVVSNKANDSGYMSKDRKRKLRKEGIFNGITERRVRGQSKLRAKQSKNNTQFSKVRALVELPFAFIKKLMNYTQTKYLGIKKNSQHVFMIAAAYNLRRIPNLRLKMA